LTAFGPLTVIAVFVLFCRIGTCLLLMPGFSSSRIPAQVRLFLALAVTLALTPLLLPAAQPAVTGLSVSVLGPLIAAEVAIGAMIGLLGRIFFLALQMLATAATTSIGFAGLPEPSVVDEEPEPSLVSLIMLTALMLLFLTEQHWEILRGLAASYAALPVSGVFDAQFGLGQLADNLSSAFFLALRITSPFIIYAVIVNFAIGLVNKLTPQIPVYFISAPFVIAGGLFLLYFAVQELMALFAEGFAAWIATG
jgi:flagellar biosynthetic protein FliR